MLILLIRFVFVVLAALIGATSGRFFYEPMFGVGLPWWFGAAIGFGVAVTLIAAEQAFRRHFTRSLVAFLIGLAGGLILSALLLTVLHQVLQDAELYRNLDLPLALLTTYLVIVTVVRSADRLRVIVPFVEFRAERADGGGALILDPAVLGDARLPALLLAGLSASRVLLHRSVLEHWQHAVGDGDAVRRARAKRAVDAVPTLRAAGMPPLEIDDTEIPHASDLIDTVIRLGPARERPPGRLRSRAGAPRLSRGRAGGRSLGHRRRHGSGDRPGRYRRGAGRKAGRGQRPGRRPSR